MKVSVLGTRGFPSVQGGVETHCEHLYPHIVDDQHCQVTVFTREPYIHTPEHRYKHVRLLKLSCPKNKFLEAIVHTVRGVWIAKRLKPDILHIHAIGPSLFVPLARLLGMTVVVTNHGPDYKRKKWPFYAKTFLKFCEWCGVSFANEVIVIAENIREDIRKKYGRNSVVIPNGVDIPHADLTHDELLKKHGVEKQKYILAVGRFVPEKGFHDLIEAFASLDLPGWKLVIAGGADHEDTYSAALKKEAAYHKNVVLTGFLDKESLAQFYTHAGLFILPSYYEGLPIVLLEAMSYGLSCLISDIPAHQGIEIEKDRFFAAGDKEGMARKIKEFVTKPMNEEQKIHEIDMVRSQYDWEKIAGQTFKVYCKALKQPSLAA